MTLRYRGSRVAGRIEAAFYSRIANREQPSPDTRPQARAKNDRRCHNPRPGHPTPASMRSPFPTTLSRRAVLTMTALLTLPLPTVAARAADDGFAPFWKAFQGEVARNSADGVQRLTRLPFLFENKERGAAEFGAVYRALFTPKVRACIAQAKPMAEDDGHVVFCAPTSFYFRRERDAWRFVEFSADGED